MAGVSLPVWRREDLCCVPGAAALGYRISLPEMRGCQGLADGRWSCSGCGRKVSVTAGTIFDRSRIPLQQWFAAAWYMSWFRKFGQRDKWKGCSPTAIKMAETRSNDDTTSTPEPHSGLQGEGGLGRTEGRQDPGRVGPAV